MKRERRAKVHRVEWARHSNRGQAIVLVVFVFIALALFTGLVVDGGTVLARYAQLRRGVDAAAVQASNQFREFRPLYSPGGGDMYHAAIQVVEAQGFDSSSTRVYACTGPGWTVQAGPDTAPIPPDAHDQLCPVPPPPGSVPRKLVRVDGQVVVGLPFLSLVGWRNVTVSATSVAEAAGIDLTLVLDRSSSMTFDGASTDPTVCGPARNCYPFEDVRYNAKLLVNKLYFPYDRVVLIEFDRVARVYNPSANEFQDFGSIDVRNTDLLVSDKATAISALDNPTNDSRLFIIDQCVTSHGCTDRNMPGVNYPANTNTGGALRAATTILAVQGRLRGGVWMMLFLSDGAPNATDPQGPSFSNGFCPPSTWSYGGVYTVPGYGNSRPAVSPYAYPYCRRLNVAAGSGTTPDSDLPYAQISRACIYTDTSTCAEGTTISRGTDPSGYQYKYDAVDYARDQADYMASNGIVAFVIGLGSEVSGSTLNQSTRLYSSGIFDPINNPGREPNAGERLLRYVADVGTQPNLWQCYSNYWAAGTTEKPAKEHCGNYWFAEHGSSLQAIFDAIANRIFTRIAQ